MDLYLKATTEAEMNTALTTAGVLVDIDGELYPAVGVSYDPIGPFTRIDTSVTPPVETNYPEWHVNIRSYDLTQDQIDILTPFTLPAPTLPFRVWA